MPRPRMSAELKSRLADPLIQEALKQELQRRLADRGGDVHRFYTFKPCPTLEYQRPFLQCDANMMALICANQCVAGDTVVSTDGRMVKDIDEPFECWAWDGTQLVRSMAEKPYVSGINERFLVETEAGSALVNRRHRFLTDQGYVKVSRLNKMLRRGEVPQLVAPEAKGGLVPLIGIRREDRGAVYSFHVPVYENFFADGLVSHNSGKTLCGSRYVVSRMLGFDPLFPDLKFRHQPPIKVWACTKGALLEGLFEEVLAMCPPDEIKKGSIRRRRGELRFLMRNGSLCEMKSFDLPKEAISQAKCHLVWWDEEGPEDHWLELQFRLLSMGGQFLLTLTPVRGTTWLHRNLFEMDPKYQNQLSGPFSWFTASVLNNPYVDEEKLKEIIAQCESDPDSYQIRVLGNYLLLSGKRVFQPDVLEAHENQFGMLPLRKVNFDSSGRVDEFSRRDTSWEIYEEPIPGMGYVIGADVAEASENKGSSKSAAVVLKAANNEVVATWLGKVDTDIFGHELLFAGLFYNQALIVPEVNKQGGVVLKVLRDYGYPAIYQRETYTGRIQNLTRSLGWNTDPFSKPRMVIEMKRCFLEGHLIVPCKWLLEQMRNYEQKAIYDSDFFGYGAASGSDDGVDALAIAIQGLRQVQVSQTLNEAALDRQDVAPARRRMLDILRAKRDGDMERRFAELHANLEL